ncbi:MAG: Stk1 family PASTA domain-containing Ser/Thr kinase [Flavobacterium sp.]|nr:Stk1 family PASTA domain-containing Ser/Thr kinase [Aeromicrobium sp.]
MASMGDEALVGHVLNDRYLIGQRIARGGMASVFRATDQRLDREVAIKVMHRGLGDDEQFTNRFVREAKSAAKLNHRNVVSVFDQGKDGEITYLVMEYVPGHTLRDLMREEAPMPPYRALELLEQILIALSAAHAAKIIHRDVKPENVLITPDGDVKVADFGLARAVSAATTATGGTLIGTVSYLAPEIVVNEGADARSDIYACGAVLYEMLTGLKPHSGESPIQVAYKHVHEDIGAPSDIQAGIPPYVDALVARATVRDRDQRSTDARVMLQQVRSVQRALHAGLTDDPDLVADLMPRPRPKNDDTTPTVSVPRAAVRGTAADSAPTQSVFMPEETMQWSSLPVTSGSAASVLSDTADRPAGLHPVMSTEDYRRDKANNPRSHRGRNLLIGALLLALIAFGIGYYVNVGRYTDTPRLVGQTETQAKVAVAGDGFGWKVDERRFSENEPLGTVMSTSPDPGEKILPGGVITAVISRGKDRVRLPKDLEGMTLKEATASLTDVRLKVGATRKRYDEKVDKDLVLGAIDFTTDNALKPGTAIDLYLSRGRQPIKVTDYTGQDASGARAALEGVGFDVTTSEAFSDDVDKGAIVSQSPASGEAFRNDDIALVVSKGPKRIAVPDVMGLTRINASRALRVKGFKVSVRNVVPITDTVRFQAPNSDEKAPRGSTVVIYI